MLDYFLLVYPLCFNYIGCYMYKLKVLYVYFFYLQLTKEIGLQEEEKSLQWSDAENHEDDII